MKHTMRGTEREYWHRHRIKWMIAGQPMRDVDEVYHHYLFIYLDRIVLVVAGWRKLDIYRIHSCWWRASIKGHPSKSPKDEKKEFWPRWWCRVNRAPNPNKSEAFSFPRAIIKVCNSLPDTKKVERSYMPLVWSFFSPSTPLPPNLALTMTNCRCKKSKIPICQNMLLFLAS